MKNLFLFIGCLLLKSMAIAQIGIIVTAAGNGTNGYTGDSGLAQFAELNFPDAMAFDAIGNMYISDRDNHVIRMVDTNDIITTFAGNGFPGQAGDGGLAANAEFAAVYGLAFDKAGNLYIADDAVRKIDRATGIINTIAGGGTNSPGDGGPATQARLYSVQQMAFDAAGNLYVTDGRNSTVRKVDTLGIITTVAGNNTSGCTGDGGPATAAKLNMPEGLAFDNAGNLYIADAGNSNIRKVDAQTQTISTICGDPDGRDQGLTGDGGPARLAELNGPSCLAFDAAGNLFINDNMNEVVRKISSAGIITTIAGQAEPGGASTDIDGVPATTDRLREPYAIAFGNNGSLYIAEPGNFKVRRIGPTSATAIQSVANQIQFKSYPNPANDLLNVESADFSNGEVIAAVYNVTGQLMSVSNTLLGNKMQFNTAALTPGMYFISLVSLSGTGTVRFVKE